MKLPTTHKKIEKNPSVKSMGRKVLSNQWRQLPILQENFGTLILRKRYWTIASLIAMP